MDYITTKFPISDEEYNELDEQFGKLMYHQMWVLLNQNSGNNISFSREDLVQDLRLSLVKVASYHKRQEYIDSCIEAIFKHSRDNEKYRDKCDHLKNLWEKKIPKKKFGAKHENQLEEIVKQIVPEVERPNKYAKLNINDRCIRYCKTSLWNVIKYTGKRITKEKSIRNGMVSLSNHDHICWNSNS